MGFLRLSLATAPVAQWPPEPDRLAGGAIPIAQAGIVRAYGLKKIVWPSATVPKRLLPVVLAVRP
jgi:hypothetical protein